MSKSSKTRTARASERHTQAPQPIVFDPIFKPKPWGGRTLATLFGKQLPPQAPIGESWEVSHLPGNESRVRSGALAGRAIGELLDEWGAGLVGGAPLVEGRFPLLIKFLDAHEHLSVQVHPKPPDDDPTAWRPGIKHESWYVLHAEPGAEMFIGLDPGVGPQQMREAADSPRMADLLRRRPVQTGDCFYLPSGTPHALGAGIVVAEVQTPSDVTYRLYDWNRVGLDGKPRELHIEDGLANVRYDVPNDLIVQQRRRIGHPLGGATRVVTCERFTIDRLDLPAELNATLGIDAMLIWIVLSGRGRVQAASPLEFTRGDVVVIPAGAAPKARVETYEPLQALEVRLVEH